MRALIVYAHPEPTSFTAALKERAVAALMSEGWEVDVSDLHAENFNPVAGRHDFAGEPADGTRFHYQTEQGKAAAEDGFAPDLAREQARVARADLLVFLFPLWWGGPPAIVKGWLERVLAYGFAYVDGARFESGFFRNKRGLIGVVTGGTPQRFSETGVYGPIEKVLWPMQRLALEYMGLRVFPPFVAYAAPRVDAQQREIYLDAFAQRVREAASG